MFDSRKFYFILVISVISLSVISFIVTFTSINIMTKNNIEEFKKQIIAQKKQELKDRISIVYKIIETNYKDTLLKYRIKKAEELSKKRLEALFHLLNAYYKVHKNDKNLEEDIKLIVKNSTYDYKKFYFWINDLYPKMIMHPILDYLNNKSLKNVKDKKGIYLFNEIVKLVKAKKEGIISYYWTDPKHNTIEKKASYVKLFKPLNWVIGTGIYIKDNTKNIQQKTLKEIKNATFGNNGYFWINNMNYKIIMHPIKKYEYNDQISNAPFVKLAIKALEKSKDKFTFVEYTFYNPATKNYEKKLSIVEIFKPWGWMIGTGVYLADVERTINKMKDIAKQEINKILWILVLINILVIVFILVIARNILESYEKLATTDKLTKIFNRLKIDEILENQFEIAKRYNRELSIIFFDIDHFKKVNDTYGHKKGDYVLQEIASLVSKHIRKSDFFGRWGGEEFLIILPETNLEEAYNVAEKIRKIIENHNFEEVGKITCSFGVVSFNNEKNINSLIEKADKLLYKSKKEGRNRVSK